MRLSILKVKTIDNKYLWKLTDIYEFLSYLVSIIKPYQEKSILGHHKNGMHGYLGLW